MTVVYVIRSRGAPFNMRSPTRKGWCHEIPPKNRVCAVEYHRGFITGTCFSSAEKPNATSIVSNVHWANRYCLDNWVISKTVAKETILELAQDILSSHLHCRALWNKYYPTDENPFEKYFTMGSFPPLTYELDGTQIPMLINGFMPANVRALRPFSLSLAPAPQIQPASSSPALTLPAVTPFPDCGHSTSTLAPQGHSRGALGNILNSGSRDNLDVESSTLSSSENSTGDKILTPSSSKEDSLALENANTIIDSFPLLPPALPTHPNREKTQSTNVGPIRTPRTSRPRLSMTASRRSTLAGAQELRSAEEEGEIESNGVAAMRRRLDQLSALGWESAPMGSRLSLDVMNHLTR